MTGHTQALRNCLEEQFFDEVLRDKVFNFAKDLKHDGYQRGLTAILQKTSGANTSGSEFKN